MSETKTETIVHGMMAEFTTVDSLLDACRRVRDAGYTKTDAYTPFAVHGIDKALGIKPTILPWIALIAGVTGTAIALAMQIWMNGIDYKYIISGKPYISLPAFMPVAFELTILLASFGTFFGMWALNGLPRFSNPMFTDPRFDRATDDRFFLYIDSKDERYDAEGVRRLLADTGSEYINEVVEDDSPTEVPKPVFMVWGLMVAVSIIPLLVVLTMRVTTSSKPRFPCLLRHGLFARPGRPTVDQPVRRQPCDAAGCPRNGRTRPNGFVTGCADRNRCRKTLRNRPAESRAIGAGLPARR